MRLFRDKAAAWLLALTLPALAQEPLPNPSQLLDSPGTVWSGAERSALPAVAPSQKLDSSGRLVLGENSDHLPPGCTKIADELTLTIRVGKRYAQPFPGTVFGFDRHEWRAPKCTRITVRLINEDQVRHQFLITGLPEEIYPGGVFLLEVDGPGEVEGTFITPHEDRTYPVLSALPQQAEKGLKGQFIVGGGSGLLPSIPGITAPAVEEDYLTGERFLVTHHEAREPLFSGMLVLGFLVAFFAAPYLFEWLGQRLFHRSGRELSQLLFDRLVALVCGAVQLSRRLLKRS